MDFTNEKMKKITLMYDFFSEPGGLERVLFFQAKILKKYGYDVQLAFAYVDEKLRNEFLKDYEVIEYGSLLAKNESLQICSSLIRDSALGKLKESDMIICHSFPSSYLAYKLKKKYGIPYIQFMHHLPQFLYYANLNWANNTLKRKIAFASGKVLRNPLKKLDSLCAKNAKMIMVNSEMVKKSVKEAYGLDSTVCYPPLAEEFSKPLEKFSGTNEPFILGSGRIVKQKRFDYLIEAVSKLKTKKIPIVFAGKYDLKNKEELENLAKKKGVKIKFLGMLKLNELRSIYSKAKVTVLTCPKEYFGLVPIEAAACGCPTVAWRDGAGPEETVIDDVNGFLAEAYDTNDLADKINKCLDKKWDKNKIKNSVKKFSEEAIGKQFISLVKKLL